MTRLKKFQNSEVDSIAKRYNQIAVDSSDFDNFSSGRLVRKKHHKFVRVLALLEKVQSFLLK